MMPGNRLRLAYVSTTREDFGVQQINDLLRESRTRNRSLNIRGLLLYKGGEFFQILEGERCAVDELYDSIRKDPRHRNIQLLLRQDGSDGMFSDWYMGYVDLDQDCIPGLERILEDGNFCALYPNDARVKELIAGFAGGTWRRCIRGSERMPAIVPS